MILNILYSLVFLDRFDGLYLKKKNSKLLATKKKKKKKNSHFVMFIVLVEGEANSGIFNPRDGTDPGR